MAPAASLGDAALAGDEDRAVVLDGDVHAELLLQRVDGLAAGAYEHPDLVLRDLDDLDPGGVVRDLGPRLGDGLAQDL